jgi:DNA-binding HxlR family transcriptional regulator
MPATKQYIAPDSPICDKVFKMFGDKWTLRITSSLRNGALRFREIQNFLSINSATLTTRLKRMEDMGLLHRDVETIDKQSVTYSLTKNGEHLLPIYDDMIGFGEKLMKK